MLAWILGVVKAAALMRSIWLLIGLVRLVPVHLGARTRRWGPTEVLTLAELPIFFVLTASLFFFPPPPPQAGLATLLAAAAGALLASAGVAVSVWSVRTTLSRDVILDAGHFVKTDHPLVTTGAYGFVRNPMYLGVFLIWIGIALAYRQPLVVATAALYVIPVYWIYIRAEERMLSEEFGAPYEEYKSRVGRLLPRLR